MCEFVQFVKKVGDEYLPALCRQFDYFWHMSGERYLCCGKHVKAAIAGVFLTVFGLLVLSFDNVKTKPGTTIVRDKIFGIEQRYFLVYFNGLLLYLFLLVLMEENSGLVG